MTTEDTLRAALEVFKTKDTPDGPCFCLAPPRAQHHGQCAKARAILAAAAPTPAAERPMTFHERHAQKCADCGRDYDSWLHVEGTAGHHLFRPPPAPERCENCTHVSHEGMCQYENDGWTCACALAPPAPEPSTADNVEAVRGPDGFYVLSTDAPEPSTALVEALVARLKRWADSGYAPPAGWLRSDLLAIVAAARAGEQQPCPACGSRLHDNPDVCTTPPAKVPTPPAPEPSAALVDEAHERLERCCYLRHSDSEACAAARAEFDVEALAELVKAVDRAVGILRDYSHGEECAVYAEDDDLVDVYDDPTNEACDCGLRDLIITLSESAARARRGSEG